MLKARILSNDDKSDASAYNFCQEPLEANQPPRSLPFSMNDQFQLRRFA